MLERTTRSIPSTIKKHKKILYLVHTNNIMYNTHIYSATMCHSFMGMIMSSIGPLWVAEEDACTLFNPLCLIFRQNFFF